MVYTKMAYFCILLRSFLIYEACRFKLSYISRHLMTQCINKVYVMLRAVYISLDSLNDHNVVMVYKSRGIDICEKYKIYTAELIFFVLPLVFLVAAMRKDY